LKKGLIIKSTGSWYLVRDDEGNRYECKIKGNLRIRGIKTTNPVAVGDHVLFELQLIGNESAKTVPGLIHAVEERKNYIIRKSQNLSKQAHIIAANIDQAFLVVTISQPVTTTTFIDRYLASAEAYRAPVVLILNKTDLYNEEEMSVVGEWTKLYTKLGYPCIPCSVMNGNGMEELARLMKDKISVFNGHSGVGKTTIINTIQPGLNLRIGSISGYHERGKHTTTHSEMVELNFGGYIIDTPGIKAYGMLEMEAWEISHYFREIFILSSGCQYNNCSHTHEPGCAVKTAVESGEIGLSRYISYLGLLEEDQKYRPAY